MLSCQETQPRRFSQAIFSVLTALLLMVAAPAMANVTIEGVTEGQVVTGDLEVSAVSDVNRLIDVMIVLTGPNGTEIVNRSTANRVYLVNAAGDALRGVAWDSTKVTAGAYTVAAYATARDRSGEKVTTSTVNFTIENDNAPVPLVVAAPAQSAAPAAPVESASPQADLVETGGAVEVAEVSEVFEVVRAATDTPVATLQPVVQPALRAAASTDATIAFAAGSPSQRIMGDSTTVRLELQNPASNADVLILVWDLERRELVPGVSAVLSPSSLVIPSSLLDQLPLGNMELQAHYRVNGRIQQTIKRPIINAGPTTVVEATGAGDLPTVSFPANTPDTFTSGSTQGLSFDVDGALPSNGDVLAIAWSLDESKLVPGFAQVFNQQPWTISPQMLNLLPQGRVEVQLRPRYNGQIAGKVVHVLNVRRTNVADLPVPADSAAPVASGDSVSGEDAQAGGDDSQTSDDAVVEATPDSGSGDPVATPEANAGDTPGESPSESANVEIAFATGTPTQYVPGSSEPITLDLDGSLPTGGDVLMLMWHKDRGEMVEGFAHELTGNNLQVSNARLDAVPAGNVELQALLRVPSQPIVVRRMSMFIVDPDAPADEQVADNRESNTNYDNLNLSSDGFTQFTRSADTRVIYVAANGDDDNDGLTTATPMRTASAAYRKLRNGMPDWLLFKSGDTFRGNLGTISKSGRSSSEPMLISTYGEGPRPIMLSPGNNWAAKFFQTNGDHVAFVGLHIISEDKDFTRPGFNSRNLTDEEWNTSAITFLGDAQDVLIEDCIMEYFKFAIVMQSSPNDGHIRDVRIRRNAILNSYGHWDRNVAGHSSGLYAAYADGLLIEENVWHHNGWSDEVDGARKTKFNHNMYVQDNCTGNTVVRGNIITDASSHGLQLRSGGDVIDNLFVGNPLAFFVGRFESDVLRNVVMKSQDIGPGEDIRGHGIEILPSLFARVENNIISQKQGSADFAYAIGFNYERNYVEFLDGRPFRASLKDNKIYRWPRNNGTSSAIRFGTQPEMSANTRNALDRASGGDSDPPWIDPERDVESYMESIGQRDSLDALIQAASFRPRGQWAEEFSAAAVNHYIRRGFDVQPFD